MQASVKITDNGGELNTDLTSPELLTDCNNATDPRKIYWANRPTGASWWLIRPVVKRNSNLVQMAYRMNNTATSESPIYTRYTSDNGTFSDWVKLPMVTETPKYVRAGWANSITFTVNTGRQAIVIGGHSVFITLTNYADGLAVLKIKEDAECTVTRDASTITEITASLNSGNNAVWSVIII